MNPLRQFFENLAYEWDASQPPDRDLILKRLLAPLDHDIRQCDSVLEVGTGTGALIPILRQHHPTNGLVSIDLAQHMLSKAKERAPGARLVQSDVHHLPFQASSFNAVICHNSFPHFWQKPAALAEIRRILCLNGKLFILHDLSRERVNFIHQNAENPVIHQDLLPSGRKLAGMLEKAGFSPVLVEDDQTHFIVHGEASN